LKSRSLNYNWVYLVAQSMQMSYGKGFYVLRLRLGIGMYKKLQHYNKSQHDYLINSWTIGVIIPTNCYTLQNLNHSCVKHRLNWWKTGPATFGEGTGEKRNKEKRLFLSSGSGVIIQYFYCVGIIWTFGLKRFDGSYLV